VCIPSDDGHFRASVEAVLDEDPTISTADLEAGVRRVSPDVQVRRRDLGPISIETWYAYRDGSFTPPGSTSWATEPGVAWAQFDGQTAEVIDANEALISLFRPADGRMVGHFAREFVPAGAEAISARAVEVIRGVPETRSIGLAVRGDQTPILVEFVARPAADGTIEAWYRPVSVAGARQGPPG